MCAWVVVLLCGGVVCGCVLRRRRVSVSVEKEREASVVSTAQWIACRCVGRRVLRAGGQRLRSQHEAYEQPLSREKRRVEELGACVCALRQPLAVQREVRV